MRKFMGILLAVGIVSFMSYVSTGNAAILVQLPDGSKIPKASLAIAATSADAKSRTVIVNSALSAVMSNISSVGGWPSDRKLVIDEGGSIANTNKFKIDGVFTADRRHIFKGTGRVLFGSGAITEVLPEWKGAKTDGTDSAAALNWAIASGFPVSLGVGTYSAGSIIVDNESVIIRGAGTYRTKLQTLITTNSNAISTGFSSSVQQIRLEDFELIGNSGAGNAGIQIGNQSVSKYASNIVLKNLYIHGFTGTGSTGILHSRGWWFTGSGLLFENNYNNVQIPAGSVTTTIRYDQNTAFRTSLSTNFLVGNGTSNADGIVFDHCSFEGADLEALKSTASNATFTFNDCYFEVNAQNVTPSSTIDVSGSGMTDATAARLNLNNCIFHTTTNGYTLKLGNAVANINGGSGFWSNAYASGALSTTSSSIVNFYNTSLSAGVVSKLKLLPGKITAQEYYTDTAQNTNYSSSGFSLENTHLKSDQSTTFTSGFSTYVGQKYQIVSRATLDFTTAGAPDNNVGTVFTATSVKTLGSGDALLADPTYATVGAAAGTGASVTLSNATDVKGQIRLITGSASMSTGTYVTVTFNKAYARAPVVVLTGASGNGALWMRTNSVAAVATTTNFILDFSIAAGTGLTGYINYIVIE